MQKVPQPERVERLKWARWMLGAAGVLMLAAGSFVSEGWPVLIPGFIIVIVAASLR